MKAISANQRAEVIQLLSDHSISEIMNITGLGKNTIWRISNSYYNPPPIEDTSESLNSSLLVLQSHIANGALPESVAAQLNTTIASLQHTDTLLWVHL